MAQPVVNEFYDEFVFNEPTEYIGYMVDKYYDIYSDTNVLFKSNDLQLIRKPKSK